MMKKLWCRVHDSGVDVYPGEKMACKNKDETPCVIGFKDEKGNWEGRKKENAGGEIDGKKCS